METFLQECIEVEGTAARIYRTLRQTVAADPDLKDVWLAMADDEGEHAREIRLALNLLQENVIDGGLIPIAEVEGLLVRAGALLDRVKREPLAVEEALRLSRHLEEDFLQVHVLCAVRFVDTDLRRVFAYLGHADQDHIARLAACCRKYGVLEEGSGPDHP